MKKLMQQTVIIWIMILSNLVANSQVSNPTNGPGVVTDYVGWNSGVTFPLNIRHNATNRPINFWTGTTQRMTILGGSGVNSGRVGIGNNFTNPARRLEVKDNDYQLRLSRTTGSAYSEFLTNSSGYLGIMTSGSRVGMGLTTPQANLHLHSSGGFFSLTTLKLTNGSTGSGSSDGISLFNFGNLAFSGNNEDDTILSGCESGRNNQTGKRNIYVGVALGTEEIVKGKIVL